jgi:hypothetical protein
MDTYLSEWDNDVWFVLDQCTELDFYNASWLKQQSVINYYFSWFTFYFQNETVKFVTLVVQTKDVIIKVQTSV